jgi:hypothetical protein
VGLENVRLVPSSQATPENPVALKMLDPENIMETSLEVSLRGDAWRARTLSSCRITVERVTVMEFVVVCPIIETIAAGSELALSHVTLLALITRLCAVISQVIIGKVAEDTLERTS